MRKGLKRFGRLVLSGLIIAVLCCGCGEKDMKEIDRLEGDYNRYIVLMLTNRSYQEIEAFLPEMKYLYGENDPDRKRLYAFGMPGPMLLTQSAEQMRTQINAGFDMAEKFDIPVYFQLDDVTNYTGYFGHDAEPKFYENPQMCEWVCFPREGESWGGELTYGMLPRFWFNWGQWRYSPAFPNLASEEFREFVLTQLQEGVLEPLTQRLKQLTEEGKEYLFAGMAMGWETHIPDYSRDNPLVSLDEKDLPIAYRTSDRMEVWEAAAYGYGALSTLGYNEERLEEEAQEKGLTCDGLRKELLYQVIHDYSELLCKTAWEAGVPREKIFTHMVGYASYNGEENPFTPPIWCAVNDYSVPGYTLSPVTCKYDLSVLKEKIREADPQMKYFANAEGYAAGVNEEEDAWAYFNDLFGQGALVVTAFGYGDPPTQYFTFYRTKEFGYNRAVSRWLEEGAEVK